MDLDNDFIMLEVQAGFIQVCKFLISFLAITGKLFIIDPFSFHSTWAVAGCRWNTTLQELTMDFGTEFEPQGEILNIKDQTGL